MGYISLCVRARRSFREDLKEQYKFYPNLRVALAEYKTLRKEEKGITRELYY